MLLFLSALSAERKKESPLCGLSVSNDPAEAGEWAVNK